jgi:23S rRNA pseudouridine2457 synthase
VLLFNKPYGVVSQFSPSGAHRTLKDFIAVPDVYAAGRLDADSEGLVVLTDCGRLQHRITHPATKLPKAYWVQVEGLPADDCLTRLESGIELGDFVTRPARVRRIPEPPGLWEREPPIRFRKSVPTAWLEIVLVEGRNRQVRRMTAAVGLPTLRLVRWRVGAWTLGRLAPGEWREVRDRAR